MFTLRFWRGPNATFTFARHHYHTEAYLDAAGLRFVALRNSLHVDSPADLVTDGVVRGPAGYGRFAPLARDEIADVEAAFLLDDDHPTGCYDATGPVLMTMTDAAEHFSETSRKPVAFVNETLVEAYASRTHFKASKFEFNGWVTSYRVIALGEMAVVTDTVERIAGHPPISLRAFLEAER